MKGRAREYNGSIVGRQDADYRRSNDGRRRLYRRPDCSGGRAGRQGSHDAGYQKSGREKMTSVPVARRDRMGSETAQPASGRVSSGHLSLLLFFIISVLLLLAGVGFFSGMMPSGASVVEANQQTRDVQYKVIEIQKGDSLWSIAEDYMNPGFDDIYDYIRELKRCNQLDSDRITAGNYLMIPYYE